MFIMDGRQNNVDAVQLIQLRVQVYTTDITDEDHMVFKTICKTVVS